MIRLSVILSCASTGTSLLGTRTRTHAEGKRSISLSTCTGRKCKYNTTSAMADSRDYDNLRRDLVTVNPVCNGDLIDVQVTAPGGTTSNKYWIGTGFGAHITALTHDQDLRIIKVTSHSFRIDRTQPNPNTSHMHIVFCVDMYSGYAMHIATQQNYNRAQTPLVFSVKKTGYIPRRAVSVDNGLIIGRTTGGNIDALSRVGLPVGSSTDVFSVSFAPDGTYTPPEPCTDSNDPVDEYEGGVHNIMCPHGVRRELQSLGGIAIACAAGVATSLVQSFISSRITDAAGEVIGGVGSGVIALAWGIYDTMALETTGAVGSVVTAAAAVEFAAGVYCGAITTGIIAIWGNSVRADNNADWE